MSHEQLWAPWRLAYIQGEPPPQETLQTPPQRRFLPAADEECFICQCVAETDDRKNLLVRRGKKTVTILNRYPYNNGHLLVAPARHEGRLERLEEQEHLELMKDLARWLEVIERKMSAEGFNVGLNLGKVAGAGLPGHLHWHIVPRWNGDTNFMPALANVRVIPQALDSLWEFLREHSNES